MKLLNVVSSSLLALIMAAPVAMAEEDFNREKRMEQYREQIKESKEQRMEKHQYRNEKHEENKEQRKEMFQNRLKEKQTNGFRMNGGGSGGRR